MRTWLSLKIEFTLYDHAGASTTRVKFLLQQNGGCLPFFIKMQLREFLAKQKLTIVIIADMDSNYRFTLIMLNTKS